MSDISLKLKDTNQDDKTSTDATKPTVAIKMAGVVTDESSTDPQPQKKDNPLVTNGASTKNLNSSSKLSLNGDVTALKKEAGKTLDDDDDDSSSDIDSFMFGMSKIRTFFFFLSLSLLVAFVLIFVFVLPCSESAQMEERTNHITDRASPVSFSKVGDMDADGKDDLAYFQKTDNDAAAGDQSRNRRDANSECLVDGSFVTCLGDITLVSSKSGSPIGTRSIGLVPDEPLVCASGGERKKISCAFKNSGNSYVVDMKSVVNNAKSNASSVSKSDCAKSDLLAVSAVSTTDNYGFIYVCTTNAGQKYYEFVNAVTLQRSEEDLFQLTSEQTLLDSEMVKNEDVDKMYQHKLVTLTKNKDNKLVLIARKLVSRDVNGGIGLEEEELAQFDVPADGESDTSWDMFISGKNIAVYSTKHVLIAGKEKQITSSSSIRSVALGGNSDFALVTVCLEGVDDNDAQEGKCHYELHDLTETGNDDNAEKGSAAKSVEMMNFDHIDNGIVHYIKGSSFNYFTAWYFKKAESEPTVDENEASASNTEDTPVDEPTVEESANEETPLEESASDEQPPVEGSANYEQPPAEGSAIDEQPLVEGSANYEQPPVKGSSNDEQPPVEESGYEELDEEAIVPTEDKTVVGDDGSASNDVEVDGKRQKRQADLDNNNLVCDGSSTVEATLIAFQPNKFEHPTPIYTKTLCLKQIISVVGVSGAGSNEPIYTLAVTGKDTVYIDSITMPQSRLLSGSFKLPWLAAEEE